MPAVDNLHISIYFQQARADTLTTALTESNPNLLKVALEKAKGNLLATALRVMNLSYIYKK